MCCIVMTMNIHSANKILSGLQECEIRRLYRLIGLWDKVYVYIHNPYNMIIGEFIVKNIYLIRNIYDLDCIKEKCISLSRNKKYLKSLNINFYTNSKFIVIEIGERKKFRVPVKLRYLRELIYDFHPPINYRILDINTCKILERIINELNESYETHYTHFSLE